MTPKEKAKELVKRFEDGLTIKDCALIAIDEAIEYEKRIIKEVQFLSDIAGHAFRCEGLYWEQVKQEIEQL
jgi:thymidine kinase